MAEWKKVVVKGDNITEEQLILSVETVDVATDSIAFVDSDGFIKKDSIVDFTSGIAGTNISASSGQLSVSTASSSALGVVKLGSDATQNVAANTVSSTTGRTYAVQLNSSDQMVVNVPWTDSNQLTTEEVEDIVGGMLDGTQTGISVSYDTTDNNLNFVVADQTLTASSSDDNVVLTMSNPTTADTVTLTAGTGITFSNVGADGFEISSTTAAGTVTVSDATDDNVNHYLVFTDSTLDGDAILKADSDFKWNPSTDTLTVTNLVVSGTTTTIDTENLLVSDTFIALNSNGTTNVDAGIVFTGTQNKVFGWDTSQEAGRFGVDYAGGDASVAGGGFSPDAWISVVHTANGDASSATSDLAQIGNIYINSATSDIYIYA